MPTCWHCKAESPATHYARIVENRTALYGPWEGWRMAGRFLVAPDGQRITPERLRGMLWAEQTSARLSRGGLLARGGDREQAGEVISKFRISLPARELFRGQA